MKGTVHKRPLKSGEVRWAYSFFAGWMEKDGVRIRDQRTKSGFRTKREAEDALRKAIEEEQRARASAQMHRVLRAILAYEEKNGTFPAFASRDKAGKPLLSWRVNLLPYLGEQELYKQFKLDEPWDSPHNKKLIPKMPAVYRPAISKERVPTHTTFLAPLGAATMFPPAGGLRVADIRNGTSTTIMLVDVRTSKAVIWTEPADLKYDAKDSFRDLAQRHGGEIMVGMVDGTVHFLPKTIDKATMAALFTRNGGEKVDIP